MESASDNVTATAECRADEIIHAIRSAPPAPERLTLVVYHRDGAERVILRPNTPVVVGRAPPSHVQIRDASLSREHARFTLSSGLVTVEDLRSTNGTWVSGVRAARAELKPGDEAILGDVIVSIQTVGPADDARTALLSHDRFRIALEDEAVRARRFGRGFAVIMVHPAQGAPAHVARFYPRVLARIQPVDRAALYSPDTLAILVLETGAEAALDLARTITAVDGEPVLLAGVASFPEAATGAEELLELCWSASRSATAEDPVRVAATRSTLSGVAGPCQKGDEPVIISPAMRHVFVTVARIAESRITVLLLGETGVGKELIARALHERSSRRGRSMVSINCGAIPPQLVESTLFGHDRGAFTGASQQQQGLFEAANGGTVFLDEIGELPPPAQIALLRVLETRRVRRVGSSREVEVDARIIAATHRDLEVMCVSGEFRRDLLYRLNAMVLTIPPLWERREEIEPLALRFLHQANQANDRAIRGFEPGALALLRGYSWPGNVRELRNAIERAVVIADGEWITEEELPERVRAACSATSGEREGEEPALGAAGRADSFKVRLMRYEAEIIVEALREAGWNQTAAANALGMPLRTLVHKMKALGIKKLGYGHGQDGA
jgi:DNA-binding NtrC family response regulator